MSVSSFQNFEGLSRKKSKDIQKFYTERNLISLVCDNIVITQNQRFFRRRILNFQNAIQYYK